MGSKTQALGIITILVSILVGGTIFLLISNNNDEESKNNDDIIDDDREIINEKYLFYHGINISWLGEAAFKIKAGERVVYIDPYFLPSDAEKAEVIVCTHHHGEHLSVTDVYYGGDGNTSLYTPEPDPSIDGIGPTPSVLFTLSLGNVTFIKPGIVVNQSDIILEFVPAYNIDKYNPNTADLWHPPRANWTGVIVEIKGTRIYHPGDSGHIPEMKQIDCDIFLAPVGGVAVMTPQEAAEAVESLKINSNLKYAIPMHYPYVPFPSPYKPSTEFAEKANCTVVILNPY